MLQDKDKHDIKQIAKDTQDIQYQAALTAASLIKKLLKRVKESPNVQKNLKVDLERPANVQIDVGGKAAYRGVEGKNPHFNNLSNKDLQYLDQAINLQAGQKVPSFNRDVNIKIDDKEVFRLRNGVVELNLLNPERTKEQKHVVEATQAQPREASSVKESNSKPPQVSQPRQQTTMVQPKETALNQSQPQPSQLSRPRQIEIEDGDRPPSEPRQIEIEDGDRPALNQQTVQPQAKTSSSTVTLNNSDREQLESRGIDPAKVESQAVQSIQQRQANSKGAVEYVPVVVLAQKESQKIASTTEKKPLAQVVQAVKAAPAKVLESIKQGLGNLKEQASQAKQALGQVFNQAKQPFKGPEPRRQDLNGLATALTAERLIERFGKEHSTGAKVFEGNAYQIAKTQDGFLKINAKDGRGNLLEFGDGRLQGNLAKSDIAQFQKLDSELDKAEARVAVKEKPSPEKSKKDQMELN